MFFGVGRLAAAAARKGATLHLLTDHRAIYSYDLERTGTGGLVVHDVDTRDPDAVTAALEAIGEVAGVIGPVEKTDMLTLDVIARLGLRGPAAEAVRLVRDKRRLRAHLADAGLSKGAGVLADPATARWDELTAAVGSPFVVKDTAGSSSQNVWLIRSQEEFDGLRGTLRDAHPTGRLMAESYFVGPLYSAETLSWHGDTRLLGISGRIMSPEPICREEALAFPVAFPAATRDEIAEWITGVLDSVGYSDGFAHTEFILTDSGFEVVEINPRIPGGPCGEHMSEVLGADLYEAMVEMALDIRPGMLDRPPAPTGGTASVPLYAPRTGVFAGIEGLDRLDAHQGDVVLHPTRSPGQTVHTVRDQSAAVAILSAGGDTAELALLNALSATRALHVAIDPA
ncbi:hypothetical protein AQI88_16575 [Streptomyces cellostaticus]|uniref:ATP-grasp domain-containing protein n=2 Tax=Streptomyces cellostaticus TaxID=67285 RepID=A0A101NMT2_9ACTN|nr:hypothetical protein AQI88_16575 [Streptomyces cellostaticus]